MSLAIDEFAEIRAAFELETAENLQEMETALLALEAAPALGENFNHIFRAVHTIKGSGSIVGAEMVEQFCHTLETLLSRVRDGEIPLSSELVSVCLQCHDHIRHLIEAFGSGAEQQEPTKRHNDLLQAVENLQNPSGTASAGGEGGDDEADGSEVAPFSQLEGNDEPSQVDRRFVRIEAVKLDLLINMVVELVTASSELESHLKRLNDVAAMESASAVSNLVKSIQERAMVFRMVPINTVFRRFSRMLHDLCADTGKQVRIVTSGGDAELDKVVAEKIRESLVHIIRNAVDHGIESPDERRLAGKPVIGTINLNAWHDSGMIVIEVSDDGRGIDREALKSQGRAMGLIRSEEAFARDPFSILFEPGFSTKGTATRLSGRGVGMDAVKRSVDELRGKIDVESSLGSGSRFLIRIPLSMSLIEGFMVSLDGVPYIIPMEYVSETIGLSVSDIDGIALRGYHDLRGEALACMDLSLKVNAAVPAAGTRFAVVVANGGKKTGLIVDELLGEVKTVVKPLGSLYHDVRIISGASILGDGTIALIINIPELVNS